MSAPRRGLRWLLNFVLDFLQRLLLWIIASGPVPDHIAFVMDGNRRYAGRRGKPVTEGHYAGYSALYRVSCFDFFILPFLHFAVARGLLPPAYPHCDRVCLCD